MKENKMALLQSTEIDQALEYFDRTHKRVLSVTAGLSDAQWTFQPAPDRWSAAQNLEHMAMVQERVLGPVAQALAEAPPAPADHDCAFIDALIFEKIPNRSVKADAPEFLVPCDQCNPGEALARVARNYQRLAQLVASTPDLRQHAVESRPLQVLTNGTYTHMDGLQWALTVASHDERHLRQIEEVQADPGYPAN
jgi:hypothetical protein